MTIRITNLCAWTLALVVSGSLAHSPRENRVRIEVSPDADWATRHMAEEHHIGSFDVRSFFSLHDYDNNGFWDTSELLKTYGLEHETNKEVTSARRDEMAQQLLGLLDGNGDGLVSLAEWVGFAESEGKVLPDLGTGSGRHWDIETDYEIHHWELYHDENTKLEDLTHPEDIAHFRQHDEMEEEAERLSALDQMAVVEQNIPEKFRRQ